MKKSEFFEIDFQKLYNLFKKGIPENWDPGPWGGTLMWDSQVCLQEIKFP